MSTALEERDVTRAWESLAGAGAAPKRTELIHRHNKSLVFRLFGVRARGASDARVIAKKCRAETARIERDAYLRLTRLQLESPAYHGFVEDADAGWGWLFIEDAAGVRFDSKDDMHRTLAARWLAALHTSTSDGVADLPDRGAAYYETHLCEARAVLRARFDELQHDAGARRVLNAALEMCDQVASVWPRIQSVSAGMPETWVHNDFSKFNVRVRKNGGAPQLMAFDWEISGRGLPTIDVLVADSREYLQCVRPHWPQVNDDAFARALEVATLWRGLASLHWETINMHPRYPEWRVRNIEIYLERMTPAQRSLERAAR